MQLSRRAAALLALLVVLGACSGNGSDDAETQTSSTTAADHGADPAGPSSTGSGTSLDQSVAEAAGWRLGVSQPKPGAAISPRTELCYELSGPTREPVAALDVSLLSSGSAVSPPLRIAASVGRAAATLRLSDAKPGVYDLRVQLIANGERVDGVAVTIASVALTPDTPAVTCA